MNDQIGIQATQYIISLFESSKSQSEEALDSLPGIYAIIESSGLILKGNKSLAQIFSVDYENLLGCNLDQIFSPENWQEFQNYIFRENSLPDPKINIRLSDGVARNYLWFSNPVRSNSIPNSKKLFAITGRDVTDLTRITEENSRMQFELSTAKIVQNTFYPKPSAKFGNSTISGYSESASECGGDWWHYNNKKDKLYLWIGDVTGHGVTAALVVSAVHAVVSIIDVNDLKPKDILALLNRAVGSMAGDQRPMTFLVAAIDLKSGECTYASAGHEPLIMLPADKDKFEMRDLKILQGSASAPLGAQKTFDYQEAKIQLKKGDRLLFYTDGIYDVANSEGARWTRSTFLRTLARQATQHGQASDLVSGLHKSIVDFRQQAPLRDDATFFTFQM